MNGSKKPQWTNDHLSTLVYALKRYGRNYLKIQKLYFPNATPTQIKNKHYYLRITNVITDDELGTIKTDEIKPQKQRGLQSIPSSSSQSSTQLITTQSSSNLVEQSEIDCLQAIRLILTQSEYVQ
ncbi:Myb-like_DNA-binding domain-containing protein [Hexamita inflata]|uniref:Myb-like DNA-binding domain-containing protein n=1 Tax=Hexamita inflata TaxID=28002 RepID=A0AA86Q877_9EUKA|nr:Myb-like DNA-binding domain-containing protein [Hexamita inflata]CAI9954105.1 Myb-like DNA-binding domain-containing protein [Hexamita inflata]CAI9963306.1 Myb-like DNA-binding domain-containing protein [Hexamita inflata]